MNRLFDFALHKRYVFRRRNAEKPLDRLRDCVFDNGKKIGGVYALDLHPTIRVADFLIYPLVPQTVMCKKWDEGIAIAYMFPDFLWNGSAGGWKPFRQERLRSNGCQRHLEIVDQ